MLAAVALAVSDDTVGNDGGIQFHNMSTNTVVEGEERIDGKADGETRPVCYMGGKDGIAD